MYEELVEYKELLDSGALSQEEFDRLKAKILGIKLPAKAEQAPVKVEPPKQAEEAAAQEPTASIQEPVQEPMQEPSLEEPEESAAADEGKAIVEAIMEYKTLLDSGAISQSEFNRKKAQLLGVESDEDRALREKAEAARIERERLLAEQEAEIAREKAKRAAEEEAEAKEAKKKAKSTAFLVLKCVCAFVVITALGFGVGFISGSIPFTTITVLVSLLISLIVIVVLVVMHKRRIKREEQSGIR